MTPSEQTLVTTLVGLIIQAADKRVSLDDFEKEVKRACAEFKGRRHA
jgi:hypothetical protein